MDEELELREQLVTSVFRIKHLGSIFHTGINTKMDAHGISVAELTLMRTIKDNSVESEENMCVSDIQKHLFISNAAVSKMLGVLEKKGYITRNINTHNRRELVITLAPGKKEIINDLEREIDDKLAVIIQSLGKEKIEQFIRSVNEFVDATSNLFVE